MTQDIDQPLTTNATSGLAVGDASREFVTMTVAGQLFGIPVLKVQDVLGPQKITRIPLSPPEVSGALNLRGKIVTPIDVRRRLNLPPRAEDQFGMSIVVEHDGDQYSLVIDSVGEVLNLPAATFERNPATLNPRWREVSSGIYRLDGRLLVVLDVGRLLQFVEATAA